VPKPALVPFKHVCGTCWLFEISNQDNGLYLCNDYKVASACMLVGNLKGCIHVFGNAPIYVIIKVNWIETIVGVNKQVLNLH
jgi:hypothetical protein